MLPDRVDHHQSDREGSMAACPKCTHPHVVKAGKAKGKQRWRCRGCGYQFTRTTPRGRPPWQKSLAVFLYGHGISMNALAKMFGVWTSTILTWIRRYAADHAEKPTPSGEVIVLDIDETWHVLKKNQIPSDLVVKSQAVDIAEII
jgi:transposase-like protein